MNLYFMTAWRNGSKTPKRKTERETQMNLYYMTAWKRIPSGWVLMAMGNIIDKSGFDAAKQFAYSWGLADWEWQSRGRDEENRPTTWVIRVDKVIPEAE